jgi:hypothetical protein
MPCSGEFMAVTLPAVRPDGKSFGAAASILKPLMTILWLAQSDSDPRLQIVPEEFQKGVGNVGA